MPQRANSPPIQFETLDPYINMILSGFLISSTYNSLHLPNQSIEDSVGIIYRVLLINFDLSLGLCTYGFYMYA